jgi:uncharacterized membrane protein
MTADPGPAIFLDAVLTPNRPLAPRALIAVLLGVALLSFISGVVFVLRGAWPVSPFFGADVALLAWALHKSTIASKARERLTLTSGQLVIRRTNPKGEETVIEANPYWLSVDHDDPERVGHELALVGHGKRLVVGKFLGADERASLASALRAALREARAALPAQ